MEGSKDDVLQRIARLEQELAEIKQILKKDSESAKPQPSPIQPPPVRRIEPAAQPRAQARVPEEAKQTHPPQAAQPVRPIPASSPAHQSPKKSFDLEMLIGGRYMTYAGAGLVVIAMTLMVTFAISRGLISSRVQWGGEITLSLIFAGLGIWKVKEKEGFGQVLAATGLTGLYLSFAAAHFYKQILPFEGMITAFVVLSAASYGFSEWRGSKPFFVIGLVGGLLAGGLGFKTLPATLPLIHGLTMAPALAILFRRRWLEMTYLVWASTFLFGLANYALLDDSQWLGGLLWPDSLHRDFWTSASLWLPYSLILLAASAAYLRSHAQTPQEGGPLIAWFGPALACLGPLAFLHPSLYGPRGFGMIALLALAHWVLARTASTDSARKGQELGSLVALLFAPAFALTLREASLVYALEALALSILYQRRREAAFPVLINILACFCLVGALFTSLDSFFQGSTAPWKIADWLMDGCAPLIAAAAICLTAGALDKGEQRVISWDWHGLLAAALAASGFYSLLAWSGQTHPFSVAGAGIAVLFMASGAAWGKGAREMLSAAVAGAVLALAGTATLPSAWHMLAPNEILPSVLIIIGTLAYAGSFSRHSRQFMGLAAAGSSLVVLYPFARLAYLACLQAGADRSTAVLTSLGLFGLICTALGRWRGWAELSAAGLAYGCMALAPYFVGPSPSETWVQFSRGFESVGLLFMAGIISLLWSQAVKTDEAVKGAIHASGSLALGLPLIRIGWLYLSGSDQNMGGARALVFLFALWCIIIGAFAVVKKVKETAWSALFYFILAFTAALSLPLSGLPQFITPPGTLLSLCLVLAASLTTLAAFMQEAGWRNWALGFSLPVNWALTSLILLDAAIKPPFNFSFDASLSGAWIIYGGLVLGIGLAKNLAVLRIGGLVIFVATCVKALFYDLASLETMAKITVFMGFGLLMLALSYGYVRFAQSHKAPEPEAQDEATLTPWKDGD